jgi:hypothetical protein
MISYAPEENSTPHRTWPAAVVGIISFAAILFLSFYPAPLFDLIGGMMQ